MVILTFCWQRIFANVYLISLLSELQSSRPGWANPGARIIPSFRPGSLTSLDNGPAHRHRDREIAIATITYDHHNNDAMHISLGRVDSGSAQACQKKKNNGNNHWPWRHDEAVASPYGGLSLSLSLSNRI